jgi:integrase
MFPRKLVWYARIWTYDPEVGKFVDVPMSTRVKVEGTTGSNIWKASRERAMLEADKHARQFAEGLPGGKLTIADAYKANFKRKTNKKCAPATFEALAEKWPHVQAFFGDAKLLRTITDQNMDDFVEAMQKGKTSPKAIPQSAGSCHRVIKELYFGIRATGLTPPKFPEAGKLSKGTRSLGRAEFAKLLAFLNPTWRDHLIAYRLTGVRKGELHLLKAQHVNLGEGMLTVPGADSVNGDNGRTIPIHPQLLPILTRRIAQREGDEPLFEPWSNADRDLRAAARLAQVGKVSFNVIKASVGAELLRAGVPTREVAELYGHSSTRMVEEHYNQLKAGQHLKRALKKIKPIMFADEGDES